MGDSENQRISMRIDEGQRGTERKAMRHLFYAVERLQLTCGGQSPRANNGSLEVGH